MRLTRLQEFIDDESGQDIVEFTLLLVLIGFASLVAMTMVGSSVNPIIERTRQWLGQ